MVLFLTQTFHKKHHIGNCGRANAPCSSINNKNREYVEKKHAMVWLKESLDHVEKHLFCAEQRQ